MKPGAISRFVLFLGGAIAVGIGGSILTMPQAFYAAYGIDLAGKTSLVNEMRASGGAVLATGLLILSGAFVARLILVSAAVGALNYLAYGLSRCLSILLDGPPLSGLIASAGIELAMGLACLAVFASLTSAPHSSAA